MSVSTMTRLFQTRQAQDQMAVRTLEKTRGAEPGSEAGTEGADKAKATALDKLAAFVPTDVVTAWAAAVGLLIPTSDLQRWLIFAAAVLLLVVLIVLNSALLSKQAGTDSKPPAGARQRMVRLIFLSAVAFTIWAFAAPGSPAVMWGDNATRLFAVVALFVTPILYKAAQLWGLAPVEPKPGQ